MLCRNPPGPNLQTRDIDLNDLPGLDEVDGCGDTGRNSPQGRPVIRGQDKKGQLAAPEILLIPDILIAGEQQIETPVFRSVRQISVLQPLPSQFMRAYYLVSSQKPGAGRRSVSVEKDLHATGAGCSRELLAKAST